jgi:hypothetical protein
VTLPPKLTLAPRQCTQEQLHVRQRKVAKFNPQLVYFDGFDACCLLLYVGYVSSFVGGNPTSGWFDGTDTNVYLGNPRGMAVDSVGNIYLADSGDHTIRKITAGGTSTTVAGQYGVSGYADGVGTEAHFNGPYAVLLDTSTKV